MKALKVKYWLMTGAAAICAIFTMQRPSIAQTVASSAMPAGLQQEKTDIKELVGSVKYERDRISSLKKKYKDDEMAGNEMSVIQDQNQLTRAKGDLKMAKAYLIAEKDMFINNYNLAIRSHREVVHKDRAKLADAQIKLRKDLAAKNESADKDAFAVVSCEKDLSRDKDALNQKRIDKNTGILAINKEIKQENGQFVGSIYAENALAATEKWIEK